VAVPQSSDPPPPVAHLFVYGTLAPGDVRWPILAPFAGDDGVPDSTDGQLYDTGLGYPAAMFGGDGTILGRTFRLHMETLGEALAALDAEESSVAGGYHRIEIDTHRGYRACAYQYGHGLRLTPITTGRWSDRRTEIG
jgi:gamma-glutamylcyclotransferase (GGCT)/AIG2-like uncharacterized protein YtfP